MSLIRVYQGRDLTETHFVRNLLQAEHLHAFVLDENSSTAAFGLPAIFGQGPGIWVAREYVAAARQIIQQYEEKLRSNTPVDSKDPWKCSKCNEMIEAQFTDCWNCQAPRPGEQQSSPDDQPSDDTTDNTIQQDLDCVRCRYNLRGLPAGLRCPECGMPLLRSILDVLRSGSPADERELDRFLRKPFEAVARSMGFPVSAIIMVCHAWMQAAFPLLPTIGAENRNLNPLQLCIALRDYASVYFGGPEEAKLGLRNWGINGSDDIGRIVHGLVEAGLMEPLAVQIPPFEGLCALEVLFQLQPD